MKTAGSLRRRSLVLLLAYSLVLEGGILGFVYLSGQDTIRSQARQEADTHVRTARSAVEKALAGTVAEIDGLRAQLLLYPGPKSTRDDPIRLIEQLVLGAPRRYAEIRLQDSRSRLVYAVRAASELGALHAVTDLRAEASPAPACGENAARPCVAEPGSAAGSPELVRVAAPLDPSSTRTLTADVYLESLLEAAAELAAPPHVSLLAADHRGLVRHAADTALLRTYLASAEPPDSRRAAVDALRIVLSAHKDTRADARKLHLDLVRVAAFTGILTLLALFVSWKMTGRMAASLRHARDVADSVAAGDFSRRIQIRRDDEMGALIESFNSLAARLQASYREQHDLNLRLQSQLDEIRRTRRRLSERQRLAVVGEALSRVSHEIQNRIGAAGVWVQNLERYGASDETTRACVRALRESLDSLRDMLVHFKRFYRTPKLERRRVAAGELAASAVRQVAAETEARRLTVELDVPPGLFVDADPNQLTGAIVNILLNAASFSPEGGVIRAEAQASDGHVVFAFHDQGPGLPPSARPFQPFFTTRESGSGLGLAIVRNIVRAHGGRVRARNHPGGGACFEIRLPAASEGETQSSYPPVG